MSLNLRLLVVAASVVLTTGALASGGGGGGGFGGGGFGGGGAPAPQRVVDENYEYGKAIFLGREPGTQKIDYCVMVEGEPKKLKRSNLRNYKNGAVNSFANALYNCDNTDQLALTTVQENQVPFVIYYLNKRYKLNLGNS